MQQFIIGLTQGSIYALIALGYTMVYGVLRLINFAHGDVYMLGAYFGVFAAARFGMRPDGTFSPLVALASFAVAMVGAAIAGIVIERFAYRPLRNSPKLTLLITAIGMSMLLEYGGQLVFGPNPQAFPALIQDRPLYDTGVWSLSLVQFLIIAGGGAAHAGASVHRAENQDRTRHARGFSGSGGGGFDGHQHRSRHRDYLCAGKRAGGGGGRFDRRLPADDHAAHRFAGRFESVCGGGFGRHRLDSRRDAGRDF